MNYDFLKVSDGSSDAALMHITAARSIGSTTIEVDIITGVPNKFIATTGTLLPSGFIDPATKRDFIGHLDGSNIEIDDFVLGSDDDGNTEGQVVIIKPNSYWANLIAQYILNATGEGTPENATFADIAAEVVTATSINVSGNGTISGNLSVSGNITITGTSSISPGSTTTADGANKIIPNKQLFTVSALAVNATVDPPSFASTEFMTGVLRIKDNGTARSLSWHANWVPIGVTLPTTTTAGKWMYVSYTVSPDSKFHVLGIARQA